MISDNIDKKFFDGELDLVVKERIGSGEIRVRDKGTLQLLKEWTTKNFIPNDPKPLENMHRIFKAIRENRGPSAHAVKDDEYKEDYQKLQHELVTEAYRSVRTLRLLLMNFPGAKSYKPPEWLQKGRIA